MKTANFELLEITVPLFYGRRFFDDGYVDNIGDHVDVLHEKYGFKNSISNESHTTGMHLKFKSGRYINHHIFYSSNGDISNHIRRRSHEETHALDQMGKISFLEKALIEEQNVFIDFKTIKKEEVRAEIGAIYVLKKESIPIWPFLFEFDLDFIKALRLYRKGKKKSKSF